MATSNQLEYFQWIFNREVEREKELINRGKIYLSIITLYLGLSGIAADKLVAGLNEGSYLPFVYVAGFIAFAAALVLVIRAMSVFRYVYPTDPETVLIEGREAWPNDARFNLERMAELAAAFEYNHPINEKRATALKYATYALFAGILLQAISLSTIALSGNVPNQ